MKNKSNRFFRLIISIVFFAGSFVYWRANNIALALLFIFIGIIFLANGIRAGKGT